MEQLDIAVGVPNLTNVLSSAQRTGPNLRLTLKPTAIQPTIAESINILPTLVASSFETRPSAVPVSTVQVAVPQVPIAESSRVSTSSTESSNRGRLPRIVPTVTTQEAKVQKQSSVVATETWQLMNRYERAIVHRILERAQGDPVATDNLRWIVKRLNTKYVPNLLQSKAIVAPFLAERFGHIQMLTHEQIDTIGHIADLSNLQNIFYQTTNIMFQRYTTNFCKRMGIDSNWLAQTENKPPTGRPSVRRFRIRNNDIIYLKPQEVDETNLQPKSSKEDRFVVFGTTGNIALMLQAIGALSDAPGQRSLPISIEAEMPDGGTEERYGRIDFDVPRKVYDNSTQKYVSVTKFVKQLIKNPRDPEAELKMNLSPLGFPQIQSLRDLRSAFEKQIFQLLRLRQQRAFRQFMILFYQQQLALEAGSPTLSQDEEEEESESASEQGESEQEIYEAEETPFPSGLEAEEGLLPPLTETEEQEIAEALGITIGQLAERRQSTRAVLTTDRECPVLLSFAEEPLEQPTDNLLTTADVTELGLVRHPTFANKVFIDSLAKGTALVDKDNFQSEFARFFYEREPDSYWKEEEDEPVVRALLEQEEEDLGEQEQSIAEAESEEE